jgi:hypothetical protein
MPIRGDLQTMSAAELLQFLALGEKTGSLEVWSPSTTVRLVFHKGRIVASASSDARQQLGELLVRHKHITEEERRRALDAQQSLGLSFGKLLVKIGAVTEFDLIKVLRMKVENEVTEMFGWHHDAEFVFIANELPTNDYLPLRLDPIALIIEASRRQDELQRQNAPAPVPAQPEPQVKATADLNERAATKRFYVAVQGKNETVSKYHAESCSIAAAKKKKKRLVFETRNEAESMGLFPCSTCLPHLVHSGL